MGKYLDFNSSNCKGCYKCLKECPTKAIKFVNHQANIIEEKCILCGKCIQICPQKAKIVHNDIDKVMEMLANNQVVASVAPSFITNFSVKDFLPIKISLVKMGFADAFETSDGALLVNKEYERLLEENKYQNFITSCCPVINRYISLYKHDALKYLAPVLTPLEAHARMIKELNPKVKVVFIGPCLAKKEEAENDPNIDAVLTFQDYTDLLKKYDISLEQLASLPLKNNMPNADIRYYPVSGGIIDTVQKSSNYTYMAVDGIDRCKKVLDNMSSFEKVVLEMNACKYGCINGPCSLKDNSIIQKILQVKSYTKVGNQRQSLPKEYTFSMEKEFNPITIDYKVPTDKEIEKILNSMGKYTKEDELNCGSCGYSFCREKAIAIFNNAAEPEMCLPFMRERAEIMSNEIIANMPCGIVVLDYNMNILDINLAAKMLYGIEEDNLKNHYVYEYIDTKEFISAYNDKHNIYNKKIDITNTKKIANLSIIFMPKQEICFALIEDITENEKNHQRVTTLELDTLNTTDEVIKKLMATAQEIASLLGETVSETKVNLLKLKKTFLEDLEKKDE